MAFNGTEGGPIPMDTASEWTGNYRNTHEGETIAHFMGRDILEEILAQDGCMGIRFYYALDGDNKKQLVLVGAEANQNDQIEGIIADLSVPCPDACSSNNPLNS